MQHAIYKNGDLIRTCTTRQQAVTVLETIRITAPRQAMSWGTGEAMHVSINGDIYDMRKVHQ